jgi:hypothetical protein
MLPSTLTIYPIPSANITATVYYFPRVVQSVYSVANGAGTFPLDDEFITPVVNLALASLFERVGDEKRAMYYRELGKQTLEDAQITFPRNDGISDIQYHDSVCG